MNQTKAEQSKGYRELLLANLQDADHAAGYLEAALEERDSDPAFLVQLLQSVIQDVIQARYGDEVLPPELQDKWVELCQVMAQTQGREIYGFVELLETLGFGVTIEAKNPDL
jgi:hypothetical protein